MKKTIRLLSESISPLYKFPTRVFVYLLILETIVFTTQYIYNGLDGYFMPSLSAFIALCLIAPWIAKYLYKTFFHRKVTDYKGLKLAFSADATATIVIGDDYLIGGRINVRDTIKAAEELHKSIFN